MSDPIDDEKPPEGVPIASVMDAIVRTTTQMDTVEFVAVAIVGRDGSLATSHGSRTGGSSLQAMMAAHFGLLRSAEKIAMQIETTNLRVLQAAKAKSDDDEKVN